MACFMTGNWEVKIPTLAALGSCGLALPWGG